MFISVDHENNDIGTLHPGSYWIDCMFVDSLQLLASYPTWESPEEQHLLIERQKFLWLETWKRAWPEGARLGTVVVPEDSREGQQHLDAMNTVGGGGLSGEEINPGDRMGQTVRQTTLGQIFRWVLEDGNKQNGVVARTAKAFRFVVHDGPECDSLYVGFKLSIGALSPVPQSR